MPFKNISYNYIVYKLTICSIFCLLSDIEINAQYTLTGPSNAFTGQTETYYANGPDIATLEWLTTNGAEYVGLNFGPDGYPADVTFNNPGLTLVACQIGDEFFNEFFVKKQVNVCDQLSAGQINGNQSLCNLGDPSILGNTISASGGDGDFSYQWQYSDNGNNGWINIFGATEITYNPPGNLANNRWYRRKVSSCNQIKFTESVLVSVAEPLTSAGTLSPFFTICYGADLPMITVENPPVGGDSNNYTYQWQVSDNGNNGWVTIDGATEATYDPPGEATSHRWYRKRVSSCGQAEYTPALWIKVYPNLDPGEITGAQTICYSEAPDALESISSANGGNNNYEYQWQYSNNGNNGWTNINGANSLEYSPENDLNADRWYRRKVESCSQTKYSNKIKVTVHPNLLAGSISTDQVICFSGDPAPLSSVNSAGGGDNIYAYQWQYSNNNNDWVNINGATSLVYDPPNGQIISRWFRRKVQSCTQTKYTNHVKISVSPELQAGSINGGGQTFCIEGNPSILGNTIAASGGDNNYSYQWQYSDNGNNNWSNIDGAMDIAYDPPAGLIDTRWYRRGVTSCEQTKYTSAVQVVVEPATVWYADMDKDGFGDMTNTIQSCEQPEGYVDNNNDTCPFEHGTGNGCGYQSLTLSDENYINTRTYQRAKTSPEDIDRESDVMESIVYYDGLGRPMQKLSPKASPIGEDMVTHVGYDPFGRQDKEWLPYEANGGDFGAFRPNSETKTENYYQQHYSTDLGNTPNPFSQKEFEPSPLSRVLKQAAPGEDWQLGNNHEIAFEYGTNVADEVILFNVATEAAKYVYEPVLIDGSGDVYYEPGELYKTITKDENHVGANSKLHTTEEFTNKQGQVLLKRTYAMVNGMEEPHDTYYVYDIFGNLTYVLPPKVETVDGVDKEELYHLCYQYKYDHKNRLVEKKIPGKEWEYMVYNKIDQPIMSQDAILRAQNKWLFTRYDVFGRIAFTGIVTGQDRVTVQTAADNAEEQWSLQTENPIEVDGISLYYDTSAYPLLGSIKELHTITYYDNYNEVRDGMAKPDGQILGQDQANNVKGLSTSSKVRVLGNKDWISSLTVYDKKGRPIWTKTNNPYLSTTDIVKTQLDFAGKTLQQQIEHTKDNNPNITTTDTFTYDHAGRLAMQEQTLNGHTETLFLNQYDGLGQLATKQVGNTMEAPLQRVDYAYNIRGWLTDINDVDNKGNDLFTFQLHYNNPTHNTAEALYNGNIAQTNWSTANTDDSKFWYMYHYDALNRIHEAQFAGGGFWDRYSLKNVDYDKNGNIQGLMRRGHTNVDATTFGATDNLVYTYDSGNKLTKVLDNGNDTYGFVDGADQNTEYVYDDNGNMVSDANKEITDIEYNHLNLPASIDMGNGNISYIYDAMGTKLKKTVSTGAVTEYAGNYIYENGALQFFSTPEGYATPNGMGGYDYVYQYKDQVNNVRLSYSDLDGNGSINPSTEILHERNYYPFGLLHSGYNNVINGTVNNIHQYQDQEFTEDLGLNTHEWKYRWSDPAIGRFWQIDPLAEQYNYQSPYAFSENRVIDSYELEGLEKVSIHTASFAPFNRFGGGFHGDGANRKFSTNTDASSRISGHMAFEVMGNSVVDVDARAEGSRSSWYFGWGDTKSEADIDFNRDDYGTSYSFSVFGNNDAFPFEATPDIDVNGSLTFGVTTNSDGNTVLNITGEINGDKFPSNETFLTDSAGTGVFLGVSGADGNPFTSLPGGNDRKMSSFNMGITFDKNNNVYSIQSGGKTYTVDEWNKKFENLDPKDDNVSTNN